MQHLYDLDVLSISETWLSFRTPVWQIPGYITYRRDREGRIRGGTLLLVKNTLVVTPINIGTSILSKIDAVRVSIDSEMGPLQILSVYAPPSLKIPSSTWEELIQCCDLNGSVILCGDFNAHAWTWGNNYNDTKGLHLSEAVDEVHLILLNDSIPTYIRPDGNGSNLDLIFVSSPLT